MLELLTRRKRLLEAECSAAHHRLLYEFLAHLHRHRQHQLHQLAREATLVQKVYTRPFFNMVIISNSIKRQ